MLEALKETFTNRLLAAERNAAMATENAKLATGMVAVATATLEKALAAVHSANLHAEDATRMARESAAALVAAREEFARLVQRG